MVLSAETNMHLRLYLLPSLFMLGAAFGIKMQSPTTCLVLLRY